MKERRLFSRHSIGTQIAALFMLLILVITGVMTYVSISVSTSELLDSSTDYTEQLILRVNAELDMYVEYIGAHYADCDLKLPDLLEHLGVSRSYFSTVFKEKTGQSFVEYLTNLRMEKAKEYLRETGLCTYEIADRIGFADPHYFSLTFRRRTGMTPKQYREAEK